jgi:N-acetylmuramoyl-L-alanine amidase
LADRFGFKDWRAIYEHPSNEELRAARPDPNLVYPGDVVNIPDVRVKTEHLATNKVHKFRVQREQVRIRLKIVVGASDEPRKGTYTLESPQLDKPRTKALEDGEVDELVPCWVRTATLTLKKPSGTIARIIELDIGTLDPKDTVEGVQARLKRLGYAPGNVDGDGGPLTRGALTAFRDHENLGEALDPFDAVVLDRLAEKAGV